MAEFTTKETIELIDFLAAGATAVDKSREDGKIDLNDVQNFFPAFFLAPNAFTGLGNIKLEWRSIKENDAARAEIVNRWKEKFDLRDDVAERDIEDLMEGLIQALAAGARIVKPVKVEEV